MPIVGDEEVLSAASSAIPEWVAKARALLVQFDLPHRGDEGAQMAAAACVGAIMVNGVAQMAAEDHALAPSTARMVESLCGRAVDTFLAIVAEERGLIVQVPEG